MGTRPVAWSAFAVLAMALVARADSIQKWRAPDGSLYFGDRPPAGSTLVETIADTPRREGEITVVGPSDLEKEAAQGREIMRQRALDRASERQLEAEQRARDAALAERELELDSVPEVVVVSPLPRRRHHHHRHDGDGDYHRDRGDSPPRIGDRRPPPPLPSPAASSGRFLTAPSGGTTKPAGH